MGVPCTERYAFPAETLRLYASNADGRPACRKQRGSPTAALLRCRFPKFSRAVPIQCNYPFARPFPRRPADTRASEAIRAVILPQRQHVGRKPLIGSAAAHTLRRLWKQSDQTHHGRPSFPLLPRCNPNNFFVQNARMIIIFIVYMKTISYCKEKSKRL